MLNQTLAQIRANVREFANVKGTTALARHPDATLNDYIDRALGSLNRKLDAAQMGQRYLATSTLSTTAGSSLVPLPADFMFLISVELTVDSTRRWLDSYEMSERPALTSPDETYTGIPYTYRMLGDNLDVLPVPNATYSLPIWYVPDPTQFTADGDTFDTISRLDDYLVSYAARFVAIKDKNWDLVNQCKALIDEMTPEIAAIGRTRDRNGQTRPVDVYERDRWGRSRRR